MPAMTRQTTAPPRMMQGIAVPAESVQPEKFFALTRRHINPEKSFSYTGQTQEIIELRKSDILSGITVRFVGSLVVTLGGGTCATTAQWPYNLVKQARFTANGASNVINCAGLTLKARDIVKRADLTDRGVTQKIGAVNVVHGTLSQASESWGVGSRETAIAAATYDVELEWFVPVAEDEIDLMGSIFLQTSTADLTLALDFATPASMFVLTGAATAVLTGGFEIETTKFSIPVDEGRIVVPDLSVFHSMIQSRVANGIALGENEHRLIGQGAGKSMLRVLFQLWNGAGAASAPLKMDATNFGLLAWRYGTNETPDQLLNGAHMRYREERAYNADIGGPAWGFGCHEFAGENAFRDVVDMGTTSELRLVTTIGAGVGLASPALEYAVETVYSAGQAA